MIFRCLAADQLFAEAFDILLNVVVVSIMDLYCANLYHRRLVYCLLSRLYLCLLMIHSKCKENITTWNRKYILMVVFKSNGLPASEQAPIKLTTLGWFPIEAIVLSSL